MDNDVEVDRNIERRVVYTAMCALVDKKFDKWLSGYVQKGAVYMSREMECATDLHRYVTLWLAHGHVPFDPRMAKNEGKLVQFVNEFGKE